ncbi:MAG TPA: DUF2510 domain-containing protein [Candidatus Nanopelagicales bacterium]|jgi:hypothetical protein|nr:DUF2510 domain-containing protein [Candidatus Nanopelagicales bacterium]
MTEVVPGWYADPVQRCELRWFDGASWGEQVRSGAATGTDPLDAAGRPLLAAPRWDVPSAGPRRRMGSGAKAAIWLGAVGVVVIAVVSAIALVVLVRAAPRLTTSELERSVATSMSRQLGMPVTVDCPPSFYLGGSDGTVTCTATSQSGQVAKVEVTVRDSKVLGWDVVTDPALD